MATHSWVNSAPTGVFKNHELSSKIRMAAIKACVFMQYVKPEPGYGKKKGESITITRVANVSVPTSDVLNEHQRIPEDTISLSTQALNVSERGRAIPYTSLDVDLSYFDLENAIQSKLKEQLQLSMDGGAASAFKSGMVKMIPQALSTSTFDTDGTASTAAASNMNLYHVESLSDYLFSTLNVKPYTDSGEYVYITARKGKRGIIRDAAWIDWMKYTQVDKKFNGEIGKIENIRFVETNNTSALSDSKGTGSVLGEGVVFGADPVVMGVVEDPHLVAKESEDYGRSKGVAWYGIWGFEQIWDDSATAGEARVIHITSS